MRLFNATLEFPRVNHFSLCYDNEKTVLLEHIFLVKIYKRRGMFQKIVNMLFGNKYMMVIFLKNDKQIEFCFGKKELDQAMALKHEITQKKLTITV